MFFVVHVVYSYFRNFTQCHIRKSNNIRRFTGPSGREYKTKSSADDTTVYVKDIESVNNTITLLGKYGRATESTFNLDKHILLCGSLLTSNPKEGEVRYVTDKVKLRCMGGERGYH